MHYALIRILKPSRVLCIGSRYGFVPVVCALACKDNKRGVVDFVDAGFDEKNPNQPDHWGGVGTWKNVAPDKYFRPFGLSKYITLHVTTTQQFARTSKRKRWGYIYIDGDHSYKGARHDVDAFWKRVTMGGAMALHDIRVKRMGNLIFGVYKVWKTLKISNPGNTMELPGEFGLGIVFKPKTPTHYYYRTT